ncbi:hypothetical protein COLO4_04548 [Corchorus olitorius]|uniref:Uncharacterized protein n=1 Tax=Corchorus olitorius TaxID=93759 RepID=A0A1R3KTI4_9ROSI|nr:hypothetical protein COLO4_04548 [Corchorus olitorius]
MAKNDREREGYLRRFFSSPAHSRSLSTTECPPAQEDKDG